MALMDGEEAREEGKGRGMGWRETEGREERDRRGEERRRKLLFRAQITNVVEGSVGSVGKHLLCMRKQAGSKAAVLSSCSPAGVKGPRRGLFLALKQQGEKGLKSWLSRVTGYPRTSPEGKGFFCPQASISPTKVRDSFLDMVTGSFTPPCRGCTQPSPGVKRCQLWEASRSPVPMEGAVLWRWLGLSSVKV